MISMQANLELERFLPKSDDLYLCDVHGNIMFELGTSKPVLLG
jgi:hypothetical protein